jgi:hypothetical protein
VPARLRFAASTIAFLLPIQIYLGALVAGLDAGLVYNTWPTIDGALRAVGGTTAWFIEPAWRNLFENTLTVQFQHRMVAISSGFWQYCTPAMPGAEAGICSRRVLAGAVTLPGWPGHCHASPSGATSSGVRASDTGNHRFYDRGGAC